MFLIISKSKSPTCHKLIRISKIRSMEIKKNNDDEHVLLFSYNNGDVFDIPMENKKIAGNFYCAIGNIFVDKIDHYLGTDGEDGFIKIIDNL